MGRGLSLTGHAIGSFRTLGKLTVCDAKVRWRSCCHTQRIQTRRADNQQHEDFRYPTSRFGFRRVCQFCFEPILDQLSDDIKSGNDGSHPQADREQSSVLRRLAGDHSARQLIQFLLAVFRQTENQDFCPCREGFLSFIIFHNAKQIMPLSG